MMMPPWNPANSPSLVSSPVPSVNTLTTSRFKENRLSSWYRIGNAGADEGPKFGKRLGSKAA